MNDNIRNFAIIAHVDHGKSTLADRLLELTGVVKPGGHEEQMLDRNPISRERGITIKLAPVRMEFRTNSSELIILNLIDTPGHVDFSYEVDRTLSCVEGVILLVDATQGIQAQTISNAYKAIEKNLVIIPAVNKIDMANAEVEKTKHQLAEFLGIENEEIFEISAKTGQGVKELLVRVIEKIPSPINPKSEISGSKQILNSNDSNSKRLGLRNSDLFGTSDFGFSALIFDSYYDSHRGVIAFVRVFDGEIEKGSRLKLAAGNERFEAQEVGIFSPDLVPIKLLENGNIGYIVTNLKDIHKVRVGDMVVAEKSEETPLPGYKQVKPMVYASIFTTETKDYLGLKKALEKLYLNDSSLSFSAIYSKALGAGFRVGFLGLLHADVVAERLEREFDLSLVLTPPQVEFKKIPSNSDSSHDGHVEFYEPYVKVLIVTPQSYLGMVMQVCENFRAKFITMDNKSQVTINYEMPMSEMISNFHDALKSATSGYASFDWQLLRYEKVEADNLIIMINNEEVAEFSEIVVKNRAMERARFLCHRLHEIIPRQQFDVKIQAKYKGKIIASERIAPYRKNVLVKNSKLVGAGDVGRKRKLLEKQKEGKKLMKSVGHVEIPKEAFLKLFNRN